jgi:regulator of protease activity HflC (stomatin/prohibitin superfamily)
VAGKYRIEQIMGDNATLIAEVRSELQKELDPIGIHLKQFGFIGAPRPPASVTQTINENNQAMQVSRRKQNELAQVQADAAKVIAEAEGQRQATLIAADADSRYNRMLAESLTPLLVQNRTISKWDGHLPQVSGQSGMVPMIQLPQK